MKNIKNPFFIPVALFFCLFFPSCMSEKYLQDADYDDIVSVYDSINFRAWKNSDKSNALIRLIQLDRTDEAIFLIQNKAFKLDYANKNKETALSEAIKNENADVIIALMEGGASIDNGDVQNPIFIAVMTGNTSIIETLIQKGADINATDEYGNNAFHYVISSKRPEEMASYLISQKVDLEHKNNNGESPLFYAIKNGSITQAAILIKHKADVKTLDNAKQNLYFAAVMSKSKAGVDFVRTYNKDINAVNADRYTPLLMAISLESPEIVKKLIDLGADVELETVTTPLWHAFSNSGGVKTDCLKVIVENGADINKKNDLGETVLLRSVVTGKEALTVAFIQWGANVNIADSKGVYPIQHAVQQKASRIIGPLISGGADLQVRDKGGDTLLHSCVKASSREMIDIFLESKKINIDYPSNSGTTAAMLAFSSDKVDLGNYLISKGASLQASDKAGKTLVSYRKDYYSRQVDKANSQITSNNNTIAVLRSQNSAANQKISSLKIEENQKYNVYVELNNDYEDTKRRYNSLEIDVNNARRNMDYWDSRVTEWTRLYNNATTNSTRSSALSGLNNAKSNYNSYRQDYNALNSKLIGLSIEQAGKAIASTAAYAAYTKVSKQISEQNGIISSNNSRISSLTSENSSLTRDIATYKSEMNRY